MGMTIPQSKPLLINLEINNKAYDLPTTASAVGIDLNTGKQLYFNTSSLGWANQETITASYGIFSQNVTASNLLLTGNPGKIVNEVGLLLISSNYYANNVGADVFLFVSGASGSKGTSTRGVTVFGGDVVISGALAGGSPLAVTTPMEFFLGLSGSLQKLTNGSPYLVGSGAVNISTASNGQVKILVSEDHGTWTPAFTFGTVNDAHTYSSQVGRYYKIGRQVTANFAIALSSLGTSTGNVSLVNLPFTSEDGVDGSGAGNIIVFKNIAGGANRVVSIGGYVGPNTTSASLYHASAITTDSTPLTHANLTATTQLTGSITYISAT